MKVGNFDTLSRDSIKALQPTTSPLSFFPPPFPRTCCVFAFFILFLLFFPFFLPFLYVGNRWVIIRKSQRLLFFVFPINSLSLSSWESPFWSSISFLDWLAPIPFFFHFVGCFFNGGRRLYFLSWPFFRGAVLFSPIVGDPPPTGLFPSLTLGVVSAHDWFFVPLQVLPKG